MSIHLDIPEYQCKNCHNLFMAYYKGVKCPVCDQIEESNGEGYEFADSQVEAMIGHKKMYGQFTPPGWSTTSYCDALQWAIFRIFDYRDKNPDQDWKEKIREIEPKIKDNEYLVALFESIYKVLQPKLEQMKIKEEQILVEKESRRLINRLSRFFR